MSTSTFQQIIQRMEPLLMTLLESRFRGRNDLNGIPERGVYVFYEDGKPIYVGRSNRLKQRIMEHGRPGSAQGSATFAFKLTQERLGIPIGHSTKKENRQELEAKESFATEYKRQKERVGGMSVRVIGVDDQATQMIFEAYAVLTLATTRYNKFESGYS